MWENIKKVLGAVFALVVGLFLYERWKNKGLTYLVEMLQFKNKDIKLETEDQELAFKEAKLKQERDAVTKADDKPLSEDEVEDYWKKQ